MIDLRTTKKDVEALPDIREIVHRLQSDWLRPLRSPAQEFLSDLPYSIRCEVKHKLSAFSQRLDNISLAQNLHERLQRQASCLVEMKLTTFNGDKIKHSYLKKKMLHDENYNLTQTLADVRFFEAELNQIQADHISLHKVLTDNFKLEYSLKYNELSHLSLFNQIQALPLRHKRIVTNLGKHFLELSKDNYFQKNSPLLKK